MSLTLSYLWSSDDIHDWLLPFDNGIPKDKVHVFFFVSQVDDFAQTKRIQCN